MDPPTSLAIVGFGCCFLLFGVSFADRSIAMCASLWILVAHHLSEIGVRLVTSIAIALGNCAAQCFASQGCSGNGGFVMECRGEDAIL